ncbi:hypothetical protein HMPREF1624_07375 [Sporothrix schenckii ATCC 58251]|uniref:D-isomer specific 2-hydroxyacid dehydrogenase NAD-binding domain-containing protein n=1 Tax=Sporothrix schenckii (strain ATCC 58251 / de Perez 2211183) TaxID=1391915 RepID=U7PLM9_SPOS1|nr:hypothetical protein HMPREF1624_07375 [Sporothrix schenckii ATCC 58251]
MAPVKVAVLDDYKGHAKAYFDTLDPAAFEVVYFPDTLLPYNHASTSQADKDALVARLAPFAVISTMRERTPFPGALVDRLPNLALLLTTGSRNRGLDLDAFQRHGVPVVASVDRGEGESEGVAGPSSTAQHFVALLLAVARSVALDDLSVKTGGWQTGLAPFGLVGKTYATVGLGRLGAATAKLLHQAFGMKVIAWSANLTQQKADEQAAAQGLPAGTFAAVSREALFREADVLAIHTVLSERTRGLVTRTDLARMKQDSIFINTSRGPIVNEDDLLDVLRRGAIRRAALDVFDVEPLPQDSPWRTTSWGGPDGSSQVLLTPHTGYGERVTMETWYATQVENLLKWSRGEALPNRLA